MDPILTEQESFAWEAGEAEAEQTGDAGQSPQEQPSEVSLHEYVETFMGFIPDESGAAERKLIAYGDPGTPSGARRPINAYQSAKN